jgi:putative peptidoglycan lipid II flippase
MARPESSAMPGEATPEAVAPTSGTPDRLPADRQDPDADLGYGTFGPDPAGMAGDSAHFGGGLPLPATGSFPVVPSPDVASGAPDEDGEPSTTPGAGHLVRSSSIVGAGTLLSRITGLVRTIAIAAVLGASTLADGYNLANTTPNMIYDLLLGGVFSATLVPVFVDHHVRRDREGDSAVITVLVTALVVLTALAMVLAPWIFRLYTWNISSAADRRQIIGIGVPLLRWFLPQILFYGLTALASAMLNARRSYLAPAFAPVLNNIVVLCMLAAFWRVGGVAPSAHRVLHDGVLLTLLGAGTTAGIVVMAVSLWPALRRAGVHLRPSGRWRHRSVRQVFTLSGWTLAYALVNQVALAVVLALAASLAGSGKVTAYTYAFMFFQLPYGLFAVSLMTTVEPEMARAASVADANGFRRQFSTGLRLLLVVLVPSAVGVALLAHPIVNVLLGHGGYRNDATLTGTLLALFALGLIGYSLYLYSLRCFYALKDTRTPFLVNVVENALNVALAWLLIDRWGIQGLVAAFSIAYTVAAVLALLAVKRRILRFDGAAVWHSFVRVCGAAALMALGVVAVVEVLGTGSGFGSLPTLVAGLVAGVAIYGFAVWALRVREIDQLLTRLRSRLTR